MTPAQAILAGTALIAVAILFVNGGHPVAAMSSGGAFQLMHHSNSTANAGVFRLDTISGEVSYCYLNGTTSVELACSHPTR